jgi:hypothetical protein
MCFNLDIDRLKGFVNALALMKVGRYDAAAAEMLDSKWAKQVGAWLFAWQLPCVKENSNGTSTDSDPRQPARPDPL